MSEQPEDLSLPTTPDHAREERHTAGAFDIRNFIGGLIGIYGLILTLMGIFGDKAYARTGGVNANLWAGIIMLVGAACFMLWARLRPIVVPDHVDPVQDDPTRPAPRRQ
jgi:hypothetical protein